MGSIGMSFHECSIVQSKSNIYDTSSTYKAKITMSRSGISRAKVGFRGQPPLLSYVVPRQWGFHSETLSRVQKRYVGLEPFSTESVGVETDKTEEVEKYFVKRLEARGWGDSVRQSQQHADIGLVWDAMARIYGLGIVETKLMGCPWLVEAIDRFEERERQRATKVWLKMENSQVTGSFKARGAAYKVKKLFEQGLSEQGLVISSTGNHALAVMHACSELARSLGVRVPLEIYVPETINSRKLAKIERVAKECNAKIVMHGEDCVEAERLARSMAEGRGAVYMSPYNDVDVISGQGTIAMEILMERSSEELDAIFVPVGGGGLISGIARVVKTLAPHVRIIGCQPEVSDVMRQSVDEGSIVTIPWMKTLAEGVSGGIEEDAITLGPCMDLVDEWVTVSEEQIAHAMVGMHGHHGQQIEGAAAVTLASILKKGNDLMGKHVVAIVCGGNVASADLDAAYDIVRGAGSNDDVSPHRHLREVEGKASAF
jgi:threonine dehydratase